MKKKLFSLVIVTIMTVMLTTGLAQATQQDQLMIFNEKPSVALSEMTNWILIINNQMAVKYMGGSWPTNSAFNTLYVENDHANGNFYYVMVILPDKTAIPVTVSMIRKMTQNHPKETWDNTNMRIKNGMIETRPNGAWLPDDNLIITKKMPVLSPKRPRKLNGEPNIKGYIYYVYNQKTGNTDIFIPDMRLTWKEVAQAVGKGATVVCIGGLIFITIFFVG